MGGVAGGGSAGRGGGKLESESHTWVMNGGPSVSGVMANYSRSAGTARWRGLSLPPPSICMGSRTLRSSTAALGGGGSCRCQNTSGYVYVLSLQLKAGISCCSLADLRSYANLARLASLTLASCSGGPRGHMTREALCLPSFQQFERLAALEMEGEAPNDVWPPLLERRC